MAHPFSRISFLNVIFYRFDGYFCWSLFRGEYWIGLAQVNGESNAYWIDGTKYIGSYTEGNGGPIKCISAKLNGGNVRLKAKSCDAILKFICEDVAPPGK